MDKQKAIALVAALLPNYPTVTDWFVTSDGQAFIDKTQADDHAAFLKSEVVTVTAKEVAKESKKGN
jgi:hypothetical protein